MNNGLDGRYMAALQAWNDARAMASEIAKAVYDSDRSVQNVLDHWNTDADFPPAGQFATKVMMQSTSDGRTEIDSLARWIMGFDGWMDSFTTIWITDDQDEPMIGPSPQPTVEAAV